MPGWVIFILAFVYTGGVAIETPYALKRRMLTKVSPTCGQAGCTGHGKPLQPRGALRERDSSDAALALLRAMWWPFLFTFRIALGVVKAVGRCVRWLVFQTALTEPERQRRFAAEQAAIKRLWTELNAEPGDE